MHRFLISLVVAVCAALLTGCGSKPVTADMFKHQNSYDIEGQSVTVRMLTFDDIKDYATTMHPGDDDLKQEWENSLAKAFPRIEWTKESPVALAIPLVAGFVLDTVKAQLDAEAKLYEAQYGDSIHETGFWARFDPIKDRSNNVVGYAGAPRWLGFEIVRTTTRDKGEATSAASRIVFAMIPATQFDRHNSIPPKKSVSPKNIDSDSINAYADERLFVIKPMWVELNRSRAKVSLFGPGLVDVSVIARLDAIWIDPAQGVRNDTVANASFEFAGIGLAPGPRLVVTEMVKEGENEVKKVKRVEGDQIYIDELSDKIAGWFAGVPVSFDATTKKPKGNGTFTMAIAVTEKDQSQVREYIERGSKYLADNRDNLFQKIGGDNAQ